MRIVGIIGLGLLLAGCGEPAEKAPAASAEASPATSGAVEAAPAAFVGRWAATSDLCKDGAWTFGAGHLSTAGEVSCDYPRADKTADGFKLNGLCMAEGQTDSEGVKLTMAGPDAMRVEGKIWQGPVDLVRCPASSAS